MESLRVIFESRVLLGLSIAGIVLGLRDYFLRRLVVTRVVVHNDDLSPLVVNVLDMLSDLLHHYLFGHTFECISELAGR